MTPLTELSIHSGFVGPKAVLLAVQVVHHLVVVKITKKRCETISTPQTQKGGNFPGYLTRAQGRRSGHIIRRRERHKRL